MGAGIYGGFGNTLGSTYVNSSSIEVTYKDRGIEIPNKLKIALSKMQKKGDFIIEKSDTFSMMDVSIMSKETGVEFAKISVDGEMYLIRGDRTGTVIPKELLSKIKTGSVKLEFHSHTHNDDCIPSQADLNLMKLLRQSAGQKTSTIITPNGRTSVFDEHGVVSTGIVSNTINDELRKIYLEMFGGK